MSGTSLDGPLVGPRGNARPRIASEGDAGFSAVNELIFGKRRDDFPRAAGLDAALRQEAGEKGGPRSRTRLSELFDRLINHRNREIGHGSVGQKSAEFYGRMGRSILAASSEVLRRLDVLAGRHSSISPTSSVNPRELGQSSGTN